MRASRRSARTAARRASRTRTAKRATPRRAIKPVSKPVSKPVGKSAVLPPEPVLYRFCKSGWAVLVEGQPSQQGTRFVCPFCTHSHRVSGPVRGFRKIRKAQWIKLRRVDE